jgi:hypothetical protein
MSGTGSKLSQLQKRVLRDLLAWVEHARGRENVASADMHAPVVWLRGRGSKARADSAAFSRAVVRLERRGLLVRSSHTEGIPQPHPRAGKVRMALDEPAPRRATHLILTPAGEEVAKRLT